MTKYDNFMLSLFQDLSEPRIFEYLTEDEKMWVTENMQVFRRTAVCYK
jgi:hypothetical protein